MSGPWQPNDPSLTCTWAIGTEHAGTRVLWLQTTIDKQDILQDEDVEVGPDPFDFAFTSTMLGVATAAITLIYFLFGLARSPSTSEKS